MTWSPLIADLPMPPLSASAWLPVVSRAEVTPPDGLHAGLWRSLSFLSPLLADSSCPNLEHFSRSRVCGE